MHLLFAHGLDMDKVKLDRKGSKPTTSWSIGRVLDRCAATAAFQNDPSGVQYATKRA